MRPGRSATWSLPLALRKELQQVGLGEERHTGLLRLRQLRLAGLLAHDDAGGLRGDRVRHLRAESFECGARLLAREALERARDHVLLTRERPFDRQLLIPGLEAQAELAQLRDEPAVLVVPRPLRQRLRSLRAA